MSERAASQRIEVRVPSLLSRLYSVWYRHYRVYTRELISNGFPPFIEPLIFLAALGLGLGHYVGLIEGSSYLQFLATGIVVPPAMFTSAFECSYGTFIRLEFDKVYDGMLAASITATDLLVGEMLFAGSKSLFFSSAVLVVIWPFGLVPSPLAVLAPLMGFLTGLMFSALSLLVTSFVKNINHFNFYFTGLLTPMFFFSGIVFPLDNLPGILKTVAWALPLSHAVRLVRAFCYNRFELNMLLNGLYIAAFILVFGFLAIRRLKKRLIL
jgi:lipooligosaccharide transport system permease protein